MAGPYKRRDEPETRGQLRSEPLRPEERTAGIERKLMTARQNAHKILKRIGLVFLAVSFVELSGIVALGTPTRNFLSFSRPIFDESN